VKFDPLIHQPTRLKIMAYLAGLEAGSQVEFGALQRDLGLTEGNLSRHLGRLEEAGYLEIAKGYEKRRPRTWIKITGTGRDALTGHLAALEEIARQAGFAEAER